LSFRREKERGEREKRPGINLRTAREKKKRETHDDKRLFSPRPHRRWKKVNLFGKRGRKSALRIITADRVEPEKRAGPHPKREESE